MPIIPLCDRFLEPENRDATTFQIASLMLFPENEAAAARWGASAYVKAVVKWWQEEAAAGREPQIGVEAVKAALEVGTSTELTKMSRFHVGIAVGMIVLDTLCRNAQNPSLAALQGVKGDTIDRFQPKLKDDGADSQGRALKQFDRNVWPILRPVAHLWAAFAPSLASRRFPCAEDNPREFLIRSEKILRIAERTHLHQSKETLLRGNEAWRVSDEHWLELTAD